MKSSRDASAHCMSSNSEHRRVDVGEPLEEQAPGREQVLAGRGLVLLEPEQVGDPRLDEARSSASGMCSSRAPRASPAPRRLFVLADPAAHPHHVRERPVGDALAVGEAAAAVPVDAGRGRRSTCRTPTPGATCRSRRSRSPRPGAPALVGAGVEEILDLAQLAVAADERRLEALRLQRAAEPETTRSARQSGVRPPCPSARARPRPRRRPSARWRGASARRRAPGPARPPTGCARPC